MTFMAGFRGAAILSYLLGDWWLFRRLTAASEASFISNISEAVFLHHTNVYSFPVLRSIVALTRNASHESDAAKPA